MGSDLDGDIALFKFGRFNPRSRVGSDNLTGLIGLSQGVSIHAPAWGATTAAIIMAICRGVSIHAPAWGATASTAADAPATIVSIHAPAWGATNLGDDITMRLMFQSTLPRGERRLSDGSREFSFEVSIHAPAWGATAVIV